MSSSNELLRDEGIITICSTITEEKMKSTVEDIVYINSIQEDKKIKNVQLILNSVGGNCWDGFMLIDIIQYSRLPIYITGLGICASMGIMILCSGFKGKRVLTRNTALLSHQYSWSEHGKYHELVAARKGQEIEKEKFIKHYLRHTKLNRKEIEKYLLPKSDVWLTSNEAKKYGIIDKIVS